MDIASQIGAVIRAFRLEKGISQEELAHQAELDRTYVSGLERGKRNPSVRALQRITDALGTTLDVFFIKAREFAETKRPRSGKRIN